jgi:predicted short-subunit dehydrogenase-like oxidoreductase (DUF2520 family)
LKQAKQLRISIIGAGRMGTALGLALRRHGYSIEALVTKTPASARRAAKLIGGGPAALTESQRNSAAWRVVVESGLLLISTPDDVLEAVALRLSRTIGRARTGRTPLVALHTSGAVSSDVLAPLRALGVSVGSLHPLFSVAGNANAQDIFRGVYFCVEGDRAATRIARSLAKDLGGHSFTIAPESKPLYHAAATVSSGHVTALFDVAIEMLKECGLTKRRARQILAPLLVSTAANLGAKSPAEALTGPFARSDVNTIKKHLAAIKLRRMNEASDLYSTLGLRSARLAQTTKRNPRALKAITKLFSR